MDESGVAIPVHTIVCRLGMAMVGNGIALTLGPIFGAYTKAFASTQASPRPAPPRPAPPRPAPPRPAHQLPPYGRRVHTVDCLRSWVCELARSHGVEMFRSP